MKNGKYEIILKEENSEVENIEVYEKVCQYLLRRYCEDYGRYESFDISESINGGTG